MISSGYRPVRRRFGLCRVKDFEPATAAAAVRSHRHGQKAIPGAVPIRSDSLRTRSIILKSRHLCAGLRRLQHDGRVIDKEQFRPDIDKCVERFLVRGPLLDQIPFVDGYHTRLACVLNQSRDFLVLRRDPSRGIDYQAAQMRAPNARFGAHNTENFHRAGNFSTRTNSRGVDEYVAITVAFIGNVDSVARRAGNFADESPFVLQHGVDERGFADVRATDNGDRNRCLPHDRFFILRLSRRKQAFDPGDQRFNSPFVLRAVGDFIGEPQPAEFCGLRRMLVHVDFVDYEQHGLSGAPELTR